MPSAEPTVDLDDDDGAIDYNALLADDLPETDDPTLARVYEYIRQANADRVEAADLRWRADRDLRRAKALDELRGDAVEVSPDDAAFLKAKEDNRLDVIAKMLGLSSTMDLRRAAAPTAANDNTPAEMLDAETLLGMDFPPIKWVVPGFVVEGLTILGGRPKLGKSWLALGFCIAVASGGHSLGGQCQAGDALYLALEDNTRRLQDRLRIVLPKIGRPDLSRMKTVTTAPKIGAGLIEMLDGWRLSAEDPRLVIVDTLAIIRPPKGRQQDSYAADYEALRPLQQWASEHRLAVVVVTHVRKMEAEDPLEMISGTNGLTGAADSILVLNRAADGPKLYGRGRDMEDVEKVLRFDAGRWSVLGDVEDVKRSDQRNNVIAAMQQGHDTPASIAKALGVPPANVQYLLGRMVAAGEADKSKFGLYTLPSESSDPSEFTDIYLPSESNSEGSKDSEGGTPNSPHFNETTQGAAL